LDKLIDGEPKKIGKIRVSVGYHTKYSIVYFIDGEPKKIGEVIL
jgi:hypothetical protein